MVKMITNPKKKTQREIDFENMPNDYPIVKRFFMAVFHTIATENYRGFKTFCDVNNIDGSNLSRLIKNPSRQFNPHYLFIMVKKYGYSAHWLITGEGPMKAK